MIVHASTDNASMQTRTETNVRTEPVADFMKWYLLRMNNGTKQRNAARALLASAVSRSGLDARPMKYATTVLIMILTIIVASFISIA